METCGWHDMFNCSDMTSKTKLGSLCLSRCMPNYCYKFSSFSLSFGIGVVCVFSSDIETKIVSREVKKLTIFIS